MAGKPASHNDGQQASRKLRLKLMASKPASHYDGQQASLKLQLWLPASESQITTSMASKPASNYDFYGQQASRKLRL